jgi:hypothetical protein
VCLGEGSVELCTGPAAPASGNHNLVKHGKCNARVQRYMACCTGTPASDPTCDAHAFPCMLIAAGGITIQLQLAAASNHSMCMLIATHLEKLCCSLCAWHLCRHLHISGWGSQSRRYRMCLAQCSCLCHSLHSSQRDTAMLRTGNLLQKPAVCSLKLSDLGGGLVASTPVIGDQLYTSFQGSSQHTTAAGCLHTSTSCAISAFTAGCMLQTLITC